MSTSYLRGLNFKDLEQLKNKLFNRLRHAEGEERRFLQIDICWVQKVQQEMLDRPANPSKSQA